MTGIYLEWLKLKKLSIFMSNSVCTLVRTRVGTEEGEDGITKRLVSHPP